MNDHPNCRSDISYTYTATSTGDWFFVDGWEPPPAPLSFFGMPLPPAPDWSSPPEFISKQALGARFERMEVEKRLDRAERRRANEGLGRKLRDGPDGRGVAEPIDNPFLPASFLPVANAAVKAAADFWDAQLRLVADPGEPYGLPAQVKEAVLAMADQLSRDARAIGGPAPPPNPNQSDCTHGGVEKGTTCPLCGNTA